MRVKLKDVCTFYTGTGFPKKYQGQLSGTYPFYKVGDIANNVVSGKVYLEQCNNYISEETLKLIKGSIIPKNTIVFAKIGEALKLNRRAITSTDCLIDNNAMGIAAKSDKLRTLFFYYFMRNIKMELLAESTTVPSVRKSRLEAYEIDIPSLDEQKIIEGKLTILSKVINLKEKQLLKLDELVKARFVEMFGDPVSNSKDLPVQKMNNVAPICQYDGSFEESVWLLNLDMVESQTGRIINYNIVSKDEIGGSVCTFDENNVLYSKLRPYLNKVVIPDGKGYATSELVPLRPDPKIINRIYLAYLLRSNEFVEMIKEKVAGAKMPRVSMSDFREFNVPVPPLELQNQFASFVQEVDKSRLLNICLKSLVESVLKIRIFSEYKKSS